MSEKSSIAIESPLFWNKNYQLIDSGNFEKLEQFGKFIVRRPEPQAVWQRHLTENEWEKLADAYFKKEKGSQEKGIWISKNHVPDKWFINYLSQNLNLKFKISLSSFKHVGLFPEQASNWEYLAREIPIFKQEKPKFLNLFAYTGGASLACKQAGADVTHVDSVKPVLSWARENMEQSKLDGIRWMAEDALKFVKREARRGNFYQGVLLDPPAYGRGPDGEKWILEEQIDELLQSVKEIIDPKEHIVLSNLYSMGFSTLIIQNLIDSIFGVQESSESGELFIPDQFGRKLPLGVYHRFHFK
ncbi:MAG: hypothetical protein RJA76_1491 [Bacteroidota bacterium]|jgi:23S rRNA (cytosine1962-C5)-methyltransferase